MTELSLAEAKAHLSAVVDDAELRHKSTVILRHNKPVAAVVPIDVVRPAKKRRPMTRKAFAALIQALGPGDDESAVLDLLSSRR